MGQIVNLGEENEGHSHEVSFEPTHLLLSKGLYFTLIPWPEILVLAPIEMGSIPYLHH